MLCHPNLLHHLGYSMNENSLLVLHLSFEKRTLRNILATNRASLSWDNQITIYVEAARELAVPHVRRHQWGLFHTSRTWTFVVLSASNTSLPSTPSPPFKTNELDCHSVSGKAFQDLLDFGNSPTPYSQWTLRLAHTQIFGNKLNAITSRTSIQQWTQRFIEVRSIFLTSS